MKTKSTTSRKKAEPPAPSGDELDDATFEDIACLYRVIIIIYIPTSLIDCQYLAIPAYHGGICNVADEFVRVANDLTNVPGSNTAFDSTTNPLRTIAPIRFTNIITYK